MMSIKRSGTCAELTSPAFLWHLRAHVIRELGSLAGLAWKGGREELRATRSAAAQMGHPKRSPRALASDCTQ